MRIKMLMLLAAAAISISAVLASGAAAAPFLIETKVTIKAESGGDFFGYVKTSDESDCANGRKVILYRLRGDTPNPPADDRVASDIAQANGGGYMWSTGNTGQRHGKFYARVKEIPLACTGDFSRVVKAQP